MTTVPLFGSILDLPIITGNYSGCEEQLVQLLRDVETVVENGQVQLLNELRDSQSLCQAQREEIETLKSALQTAGLKVPEHSNVKFHDCETKVAAKCYEQIKNLKAENTSLHKQIVSLLMTIPCEELRRLSVEEIVINLQEQIQALKTELNNSKQEKELLHKQHDYLCKLVENLKDCVAKQRKETLPLKRCSELGKQIEDLLKAALKKSADQDEADLRKIEEKFQNEIQTWADDLTHME